jgi:hypothetical protein
VFFHRQTCLPAGGQGRQTDNFLTKVVNEKKPGVPNQANQFNRLKSWFRQLAALLSDGGRQGEPCCATKGLIFYNEIGSDRK